MCICAKQESLQEQDHTYQLNLNQARSYKHNEHAIWIMHVFT